MPSENRISDWIIKNHRKYIVANKPAGIAVQHQDQEELSLEQALSAYAQCDLHTINRIDQPVSGLVLLAKSSPSAAQLHAALSEPTAHKTYLALVDKGTYPAADTLQHHLVKKGAKAFIADAKQGSAKLATLHYRTLAALDRYTLLEVTTETGRFHQIRAQLAHISAHIKGDVKYGSRRGNRDRSIHLHAWKMAYHDPIANQAVEWVAPPPSHDNLWKAAMDQVE